MKGDWLRHILYACANGATISCGACPLFHQPTLGDWMSVLDGAAALVNLAGRTVNCVKTPDHCDE